ELEKFTGHEVTRWTQVVARSDRVASHSTAAPLIDPGAYLVEAHVPGSDRGSRGLVVVTGIAVVQRSLTDRVLLWAVDARSGKPLGNQKIRIVEQNWSDESPRRDTTVLTDQKGVAEYRHAGDARGHHEGFVFASAEGRGATFGELAGQAYDYR